MELEFWIACCWGDQRKVKRLLLDQPSIDFNWQNLNWYGATPFYIACNEGNSEIAKLLLQDQRIDPLKPNNDGETPFYSACAQGHSKVVKLLLQDQRFDPMILRNDGASPFYGACSEGKIEVVELLLRNPRIDPNRATGVYITPLHIATYYGHYGVVKLLLAMAKNIDHSAMLSKEKILKINVHYMRKFLRFPQKEFLTPHDIAIAQGDSYLAKLLKQYETNPHETKLKLRLELGILEAKAAKLFNILLAYDEGSFALLSSCDNDIKRFFAIAQMLPYDLKMILALRYSSSTSDFIPQFLSNILRLR